MNFLLDDIGDFAARLAERADHIRRVGFVRPDPAVITAMGDFEEIEVVEYPTWPGIHDSLTIYRRVLMEAAAK